VFDPARVADRSTYRDPTLPPVGIQCVVVNGEVVVEDGQVTGRAGRVLRPHGRVA
jgi:N-acyl-D-amino-acid deacylase